MIDNNSVMNVRAIQKWGMEILGFIEMLMIRTCQDSKMETLTPLVNALGLDLKF